MSEVQKFIVAGTLWALAVALMVVQTLGDFGNDHMGMWALLVALGACVLTGWGIVRAERLRMERLARIMAEVTAERRMQRGI